MRQVYILFVQIAVLVSTLVAGTTGSPDYIINGNKYSGACEDIVGYNKENNYYIFAMEKSGTITFNGYNRRSYSFSGQVGGTTDLAILKASNFETVKSIFLWSEEVPSTCINPITGVSSACTTHEAPETKIEMERGKYYINIDYCGLSSYDSGTTESYSYTLDIENYIHPDQYKEASNEYNSTSYYIAYDSSDVSKYALVMPHVSKIYTHLAGQVNSGDLNDISDQFISFPSFSNGQVCFDGLSGDGNHGASTMANGCFDVPYYYIQKDGSTFFLYYQVKQTLMEGTAGESSSFSDVTSQYDFSFDNGTILVY